MIIKQEEIHPEYTDFDQVYKNQEESQIPIIVHGKTWMEITLSLFGMTFWGNELYKYSYLKVK